MDKYTTRDFDRDFPTDDACLEWLFKNRWPDGMVCAKCQKVTPHYRITERPCYSCDRCGNHVYPMAGTIFAGTRFSNLPPVVQGCGIHGRHPMRHIIPSTEP